MQGGTVGQCEDVVGGVRDPFSLYMTLFRITCGLLIREPLKSSTTVVNSKCSRSIVCQFLK